MKKYKDFLNENISSLEETEDLCKKLRLYKYKINKDLTVDVDGDVEILKMNLDIIPIRFRIVNGDFDCSYNNLKSLKGCPRKVKGDFNCMYNEIREIDYFPEFVGGDITLFKNNLKSLNGIPFDIEPDNLTYFLGNPDIEVASYWKENLRRHPMHILKIREDHIIPQELIDEYRGIIVAHRDFDVFDND